MDSILFFQYGNYAEAYERFRDGGDETYRNQKYTVNFVASLAENRDVTTVALCNAPHDIRLQPRLRSIGVHSDGLGKRKLRELFDDVQPDTIIFRSPHLGALREARRRRLRILPCFADIFQAGGPRTWLTNLRIGHILSDRSIHAVANHGLNASRSMMQHLGLPADRIVPWEWSPIAAEPDAKVAPQEETALSAFFAGALTEAKGVGICLEAIRESRALGHKVRMTFAGNGNTNFWQRRAEQLGVRDAVTFLGQVSTDEVRRQMRAHDVVVVPSQQSYPEGMPKTISEGLASRSPLVISDHPAFRGRLQNETQCLVFEAGNPADLARALKRLATDQILYATLSANAADALEGLYVGMEWSALIRQFLEDPEDRTGWVGRNSLQALGY